MAQERTNIIQSSLQFLKEVWQELTKVNWTSREQLWQSTRVVIIGAVVMAIYLGLMDFASSMVLNWFLELRL